MSKIEKLMICAKEEMHSFCKKHKEIYLYGAGRIGQTYLQILRQMGVEIQGFIVSDGVPTVLEGIPVSPASYIRERLSTDSGVIAAFKDANETTLCANLGTLPAFFFPQPGIHRILLLEDMVFPFLKRFGCGYHPLKSIADWKNILVIRLDVLGDLIMTTPFLRELRNNCPNSHITLVVRSSNKLVVQDCPYISELILYEGEQGEGAISLWPDSLLRILGRVKKFAQLNLSRRYDVAFQLCSLLDGRGALDALMLGYASGADCHIGRVYMSRASSELNQFQYERFNEVMSFVSCDSMPKHEVACMLDLLRQCGGNIQNERLELWFHDGEKQRAALRSLIVFEKEDTWIAIGVVGRLPYQCWPAKQYRQFIERFHKVHSNVRFVLLGGKEAEGAVSEIMNILPKSQAVIDLTGRTTLAQVAAVMEKCALYVGANTGLMHMAAALRKPVVEISSYVRNEDGRENSPMGAWGVPTILLQKQGMDGCIEVCSKPYPHCITQITVDEVVHAAEAFLKPRDICADA